MNEKEYDEISISNPYDGHVDKFETIADARNFAKKQNYMPVYINLYDEYGIIEDIVINVRKK